MQQPERLGAILERLSADGSLNVGEIAGQLDVSAATIRRDLRLLESQHLLGRTHGGAVPQGVLYELPLRYKSTRQPEQKLRIAREAGTRVREGWAIGLTGGTTTTEVARVLVDRHQLTIVTNALNIASELAVRPNLKLVVTGGVARSESYELVGPLAEASLHGLNLDMVFLAVDGISPRRRPHHPPRDRGPHQPRPARPRPPGDGRGRQLEDRQGRVRADLRAVRGRRADHR